jgi:hypothetical protein
MLIPPITTNSPTFGIYLSTKPTWYGYVTEGRYKGHTIDVYTAFENRKIRHKLFYVTDAVNKWLKTKLIFYKNGEKVSQVKVER